MVFLFQWHKLWRSLALPFNVKMNPFSMEQSDIATDGPVRFLGTGPFFEHLVPKRPYVKKKISNVIESSTRISWHVADSITFEIFFKTHVVIKLICDFFKNCGQTDRVTYTIRYVADKNLAFNKPGRLCVLELAQVLFYCLTGTIVPNFLNMQPLSICGK